MSTVARSEPVRPSRKKAWIAAAIALALVAVVAVVVMFTPLFTVREYKVTGNDHLPQEQVVEAAGVAEGEILAQVDVGAAASGVAGMPWVKSVTVSRGWPSSLDINITEHEAVAFLSEADGTHLINAEGEDFVVAEPPAEAIEITGDGSGEEQARKNATDIASSISEETRRRVTALEVRDQFNYEVLIDDGRRVTWGASEDNHDKAIALDTVLEREGQEFDVSNPAMIGVR
ncbi:FtsQ-type POTRA domain-containing protein [Corynebacterium breve]|uniref:FtsQ-type POTRA domain-containing protein n=1 Tax=Corynebacterium breve TaxID=3049799 RepID=A0ABY8VBC5_9CORY|nr:FtsQ-type POTRA domain-containing protein [Corynebacterium breve]WIM66971.1 FtsQ-type POTRA domain-containing protein [Corynebacterium breve]